jgi:nucleotide-binding universal stress UspA family protein
MFKKILVALDGSSTANLALKEAVTLAKEGGSKVRGVFVVDAYHVTPEVEFITVQEVIDSMRSEAASILAKAQKKFDVVGIKADTKVLETDATDGRIAEAIAREAKDWSANLIIVGTHGRRGLSHLLLGSVAESIVRVATKPVLLIRGNKD